MTPPVTISIQRGCLFSDEATAWLTKQRIPFIEHDIEADPKAVAELEVLETFVTPTLVVGDEVIYGFDVDRLSSLVATPVQECKSGASPA